MTTINPNSSSTGAYINSAATNSNTPTSNNLAKYGLNAHLAEALKFQGINVSLLNNGEPYIDTGDVHLLNIDKNNNIVDSKMSSLPITGKYISDIRRSTDGITVFKVYDINTGKNEIFIFSKIPWEEQSEYNKTFYPAQVNKLLSDK